MKILQFKSKGRVKTYKATEIKDIEFEIGWVTIGVTIHFGPGREPMELCFERNAKSHENGRESEIISTIKRLYDDLLDAWLTDTPQNAIFIVNMENEENRRWVPLSWERANTVDGFEKLKFPKDKKFLVQIGYEAMAEIEVEASDEQEAYEKAHKIASDENNDDVNEQIKSSLTEDGHIVNEIKE